MKFGETINNLKSFNKRRKHWDIWYISPFVASDKACYSRISVIESQTQAFASASLFLKSV